MVIPNSIPVIKAIVLPSGPAPGRRRGRARRARASRAGHGGRFPTTQAAGGRVHSARRAAAAGAAADRVRVR